MTDFNLDKEETRRLEKINKALGWRVPNSISHLFNETGRGAAFANAATPEEKKEPRRRLKEIFTMLDSSLPELQNANLFMTAARRVGTDEELAAHLPQGKFDSEDVRVLEKYGLNALAAVIKTSLP